MYITKITDHYGAWDLLQTNYENEYNELVEIIGRVKSIYPIIEEESNNQTQKENNIDVSDDFLSIAQQLIPSIGPLFLIPIMPLTGLAATAISTALGLNSMSDILQKKKIEYIRSELNDFTKYFTLEEWDSRPNIVSDSLIPKKVDYIKNQIGVELCFGPINLVLNSLFVNVASSYRRKEIKLGIIIVPTEELRTNNNLMVSYEWVNNFLFELTPFAIKLPFVVIGISERPTEKVVKKLTSEIDNYLTKRIGLCLEDILSLKEGVNYEFKRELSKDNKLAKEVCAMANSKGGGIILFGIEDDGVVVGVDCSQQDEIQRRISQMIDNNCTPKLKYNFIIEKLPNSEKFILVLDIEEVELKPCTYDNKVFIRSGSQARPASYDEIRKLVLGNSI